MCWAGPAGGASGLPVVDHPKPEAVCLPMIEVMPEAPGGMLRVIARPGTERSPYVRVGPDRAETLLVSVANAPQRQSARVHIFRIAHQRESGALYASADDHRD